MQYGLEHPTLKCGVKTTNPMLQHGTNRTKNNEGFSPDIPVSKEIQIKEALENSEANIAYLASLPDSKLAEKLNTVHIQMQIAEQKKNTDDLHLLEIWRNQIIDTRIHKAENNIPDTPNEIDLVIAEIETQIAKAEERQEILKEESKPPEPSTTKVQQQDDDSQLTLF